MGKKVKVLLLLVLTVLPLGAAGLDVYLRPSFNLDLDMNAFSDPLPSEAQANEWVKDVGYFRTWNAGASLAGELFFSSESRLGLSISAHIDFPWKQDHWQWDTHVYDEMWDWLDPTLFFSLGPVFRVQFSWCELMIGIRASVGSFNLFQDSVNLGIRIDPSILIPLGTERVMMNVGLSYDAHFYDFLLDDEDKIYTDGYFVLTCGAYVGLAFKWSGV